MFTEDFVDPKNIGKALSADPLEHIVVRRGDGVLLPLAAASGERPRVDRTRLLRERPRSVQRNSEESQCIRCVALFRNELVHAGTVPLEGRLAVSVVLSTIR